MWKLAGLNPIPARSPTHLRQPDDRSRINAKALSTYMGHSSITITLGRYRHLMAGNEEQAASLLDYYLAAAQT